MIDSIGVWDVFSYALTVIFGMPLIVFFAGGFKTRRDWVVFLSLCPTLLALQTYSLLAWGWAVSRQIYPLIMHLPILLGLVFGMKRPAGISLVSMCTGVLCCHLPRQTAIILGAATGSKLAEDIAYIVFSVLLFPLLLRYFVPFARDIMTESPRSLFFFGTLPILSYIYDFGIVVRSELLSFEILPFNTGYSASQAVAEAIPYVAGLLYIIYINAYRRQLRRRTEAELLSFQMAGQLRQAETEMSSLRRAENQAAAYHHDMRHHLAAIDGFLASGSSQQARDYIKQVRTDIEVITPRRFCENELVNLLCCSFFEKAERMGVLLKVEAAVPDRLTISDTELCALLSNGLENALNAVGTQKKRCRWVEVYCSVRLDKLLIEIRNSCTDRILFQDGLPVSDRPRHGYGCRSIRSIAEAHQGICEFSTEDGIFTLRVAIPV